ncbi:hypothetical protein [Pseudoclavibacter sp. VKM Ac-2888]|uniref:hypothetical protein n=1 Tax=Pseudoclavibacter sp. VKM Ac-2888 TaxID=2783830 RepID=UPI00188D0A90|nr:hypothetical protein [Pseudoclavibacter sp. VKM Ac-2888]MBF4549455.1 hypothetical protein [Pseudoclavibacter sp. VKM Ac-2888]
MTDNTSFGYSPAVAFGAPVPSSVQQLPPREPDATRPAPLPAALPATETGDETPTRRSRRSSTPAAKAARPAPAKLTRAVVGKILAIHAQVSTLDDGDRELLAGLLGGARSISNDVASLTTQLAVEGGGSKSTGKIVETLQELRSIGSELDRIERLFGLDDARRRLLWRVLASLGRLDGSPAAGDAFGTARKIATAVAELSDWDLERIERLRQATNAK